MYTEDFTLLLVRDAAEPPMWTEHWARSYPLVQSVACAAGETAAEWRDAVQAAFDAADGAVCVAAYGAATAAVAAWYAHLALTAQKRVRAVILVSPPQEVWTARDWRYPRFQCRAAWVVAADAAERGWAENTAAACGARLLIAPQSGRLAADAGRWEWGMRLMAEMLD